MMQSSNRWRSLRAVKSGAPLAPKAALAALAAVAAVVIIALWSYQALQARTAGANSLTQSIEVLRQMESLLSTVKDAETGQRGFLLTGDEAYLEPYTIAAAALAAEFKSIRALFAARSEQSQQIDALEILVGQKMQEIAKTIALRRAGQADAALAVVRTGAGKLYMNRIRDAVGDIENSERHLIVQRNQSWNDSAILSLAVTWGGSAVLLLFIGAATLIASRDYRTRRLQSWMRAGQMGLSEQLRGDQTLEKLGSNMLGFLAAFLEAQVGAVYIADGGEFRRFAGYAIAADDGLTTVRPGDGLVGQAARDNRPLHVREVPRGYLPVVSGVGSGTPDELLVMPASIDGVVHAVVELGFFGAIDPAKSELLSLVSEWIAVAVRAAKDRRRLEELLRETQMQSEELQAGQEELRVSNEELEEQGRALRESQAQMESQQVELEQINAQLEEQTQLLENQKDALARSHEILTAKSADLQRANEYKSEFLANMSHELRTPLNSTLILAKLLADNKDGNLTPTQVKFAQTITSSGNDLLHLINDVLDLSRIEAGKVDVTVEPTTLAGIIETVVKTFQPIAEQKRLLFAVTMEPGVPEKIATDPQRLGQILRNLLSNGIKFTEKGEVALRVFCPAADRVSFAVRDTGVGIAANQQDVIFEAFRQADGSIHRKFGGTGLGLSISRDLAHLLGGEITVQSEHGAGSVFTLTLPIVYSGRNSGAGAEPGRTAEQRPAPPAATLAPAQTQDDRDSAVPGGRVILIVEDDVAFASILRDLAREMGFKCVVTHTANDAVSAAAQILPSAILLDINLPDHSGLGVLDQLKGDARTRHIPVHVVSGTDYKQEALELGAIGFALKPAKREQLVEALERLEAKFLQRLRRVLIVEDDARQRESICELLAGDGVRITAVANAGDALKELRASTFDCMVMDFNLPDFSGYDLLEKMSGADDVAFPPVIVYTGRTLSRGEEERLRRFSKTIIIKDARSPERLLNEVTLFLHQVESKLPPARQQMLQRVRNRESALDGRRILIVEDDVRNVFALTSILEPKGVTVSIARNGREALEVLGRTSEHASSAMDLVLMDIMMPEMDGLTAMREIRKRSEWRNLPIIALTAKAMKDDQEKCIAAGANDYIAKPLDVEKLLSLVRVWMPK